MISNSTFITFALAIASGICLAAIGYYLTPAEIKFNNLRERKGEPGKLIDYCRDVFDTIGRTQSHVFYCSSDK